jgi:hypothetical protein
MTSTGIRRPAPLPPGAQRRAGRWSPSRPMTRPRIYVETTIPSFYHTTRTTPSALARRDWTRRWFDVARHRSILLTSTAVLDELADGEYPSREAALDLLRGLPILQVATPVADIVAVYIHNRLMPADPVGDALHLALASYNKCDFLVTWNCQHLANANKFGHFRRMNALLGLFVPVLTTPLELLGGSDETTP